MTKDPVAALAAATDNLVAAAAAKSSTMADSGSTTTASAERVPSPPLVLIQNSWLNELTARIRSRPIPWEGYQRADLVSAEELKLIKKVDAKGVGAGRGADVAKISESVSLAQCLSFPDKAPQLTCTHCRTLRNMPFSTSAC